MIVGLAGVTSTGKTTLSGAIEDEFGDRVKIMHKISRQEIFDSMQNGFTLHPDLYKNSNESRVKFDVARCRLQMKRELEARVESPAALIVDGCAIVKAAYLIYLSGQFMPAAELDSLVKEVIEYCAMYYKAVFFLPVTRMPFTAADHRYFSAEYLRKAQDAILWRLLFRELQHRIDINIFPTLENNLVFDQLRKMGI